MMGAFEYTNKAMIAAKEQNIVGRASFVNFMLKAFENFETEDADAKKLVDDMKSDNPTTVKKAQMNLASEYNTLMPVVLDKKTVQFCLEKQIKLLEAAGTADAALPNVKVAKAQIQVAELYANKSAVTLEYIQPNYEKAFKAYHQATVEYSRILNSDNKQGITPRDLGRAQYNMGEMAEKMGKTESAVNIYKLAAKNGYESAQDRLNQLAPASTSSSKSPLVSSKAASSSTTGIGDDWEFVENEKDSSPSALAGGSSKDSGGGKELGQFTKK